MADFEHPPRYKLGDLVRFPWEQGLTGRITEVMPARTPEAHTLYTVKVPMDPEPLIFLVREEGIEKA
jgi:hypothetical protein